MARRFLTALAIMAASTTALSATSPAVAVGRPHAPRVSRTTIGIFGDGSAGASTPSAINNRGQVVGAADVASAGEVIATHAFLWDRGHLRDLGTVPGQDNTDALAVTDNGWIAGESYQSDTVIGGHTDTSRRVWVWHRGVMTAIPLLQDGYAHLLGVNSRGEVLGSDFLTDSRAARPFLWQNGRLTDIGGADGDQAVAINDRGQILMNGPDSGFLLDGATRTPIPGRVLQLSDTGAVLTLVDVAPFEEHLEYWVNGVLHDLSSDAFAGDLNNHGQVIFTTVTEDPQTNDQIGTGYLWRNGVRKRLTTPQGKLIVADAINDRGWILGWDNYGFPRRPIVRLPDGRVVDLFPGVPSDDPVIINFYLATMNDRGEVLGIVEDRGTIWRIQP